MTPRKRLSRWDLLTWASSAMSVGLAGCDRLSASPETYKALSVGEQLSRYIQRALIGRTALAREYPPEAISTDFRPNGSTSPDDEVYRTHLASGFRDWRLEIGGLVERPLRLSLDELRGADARTQITRHDCVEGWSCIAKWRGARLDRLLDRAGVKPQARYVAFFCADTLELTLDGTGDYYETIDLIDAYHPQTILAYDMNDAPLSVAHGAPLRLRIERQLGYKMAKYVMRIELIESFAHLGRGRGGYWEDRGYQWYAGI